MAEQQLVDYIKKARDAGQSDDQSRVLLYKNDWTEAEVNDAFASLNQPQPKPQPQPQPQPKAQPQPQQQPQTVSQPKIAVQPQMASQPQAQPKPQMQQQVQPQAAQSNMPKMKAKSHLASKILIALIIIVVLAGAVFAIGQYWNPFSVSPQTVINSMLNNMKNVKYYSTTAQAGIEATDNNTKLSQGKLALNANSEIDATDVNNLKTDGNFAINLTSLGSASPIASFSVDTAVASGASYSKINDIIIPAAYSYPGLDISGIKGKWFKIDQDSVKALSQAKSGQVVVLDILQANNSELVKKIQDLLLAENIFTFDKQLNDEVLNGQDTYHYSLTISKEKFKDLVNTILTSETQGATNSFVPLIQNMIASFTAGLSADQLGDTNIEMWIGKKDYLLYEAKIDEVINPSNANTQFEIKFDMSNSNFNKSISVQAPANAQKIEDVFLPLLKVQKIKSDMQQIASSSALLFQTSKSYSSLCYKGLLNGYLTTYGTDLVNLNNDIISQGAQKPLCLSGVGNYCVSTQLSDGSYLCVGGTGILGTTKCVSYRTVCK
jgi:hypothetical protein